MGTTEKVSVAMGGDELRLAKTAARQEGISLSAFVTRAVRDRLAERRRMEAAREVLATFGADELPTPEQQRELMALWSIAPEKPAHRRATRKAHPGAPRRR